MVKSITPEDYERHLAADMGQLAGDPYRWVMYSFPWGEVGTALEDQEGPDEWQVFVLTSVRDGLLTAQQAIQMAVASGHGIGKGHPYGTIVETPQGRRRWGDLNVGDYLFGADGEPTRIISRNDFAGVEMYRVWFDDGSFSEVSAQHLWNVRGRQERRNNKSGWRTLETKDILELGVKRRNGRTWVKQWEIPIQGVARFEPQITPVDPYFVGVWLGDGTNGIPQYTKPAPEIAEKLRNRGYVLSERLGSVYRALGISAAFKDSAFQLPSHERYIPSEYKFNDEPVRRAVFEGLCDTDGEVHNSGSIGYSTTSLTLANDVVWLARSLGCKAMLQPSVKKPHYNGSDGEKLLGKDCYRVTINAPFNPFTHAVKRAKYKPSEHRYLARWIDRIELLGIGGGMCVTVAAEDGLYQTSDFVVTHNSALVSWLILWAISTFPDTRGVVTANTDLQLRTKTWAELSKWYKLCIVKHWFILTATALYSAKEEHRQTWRIDAIAWSENNTEAFAGLHNQGKRVILIFDEASAIPNIIWETAEGALTDADTEILWFAFGNPTRNTGRFKECWGRFRHRWIVRQVDSRTVKITNKQQLEAWVKDYGEDSDFVRVRVRGVFPRVGSMQFISAEVVDAAASPEREPMPTLQDPLIMGVDIARYGDDQFVICFRRGLDARSIPWIVRRQLDAVQIEGVIAEAINHHHPDAVFIDNGNIGAAVVDHLRNRHFDVQGIDFGSSADRAIGQTADADSVSYFNKRAEMWGNMRGWLRNGTIPDDPELKIDLTGLEYGYRMIDGRDAILLEKKEDMKKRGLASPDKGDALALTFAYPVAPSDHSAIHSARSRSGLHQKEYDPMAAMLPQFKEQSGRPGQDEGWWPHKGNI